MTAIASILHRISGVVLFLLIPLMLWMLQQSLHSVASFEALQALFKTPLGGLMVAAIGIPFIYHLIAGCRHLVMDCGIGETKRTGTATAYLVVVFSVLVVLAMGVYLW